jgi:hypothetical protein
LSKERVRERCHARIKDHPKISLSTTLFICVILSKAKNPGSFSAQNTSTSLGAREADPLRIQCAVTENRIQDDGKR